MCWAESRCHRLLFWALGSAATRQQVFGCVQGHLRLVLAAIVYNAMAQKAGLRLLPLFRALSAAMRASTYDPLLIHPPADPTAKAEPGYVITVVSSSRLCSGGAMRSSTSSPLLSNPLADLTAGTEPWRVSACSACWRPPWCMA